MSKRVAERDLSRKERDEFFRKMLAVGQIAEKLAARHPALFRQTNEEIILQAIKDNYAWKHGTALVFDVAEMKLVSRLLADRGV